MKSTHFKLLILSFSLSLSSFAQQFTKPMQEFKVGSNTKIAIEASYAEIEIVEWSKNKVEVEGIMSIQGLPEDEAKAILTVGISAHRLMQIILQSDQVRVIMVMNISLSIMINTKVM